HPAQLVEDVADARADGDPVAQGVVSEPRDRVLRHVERDRLRAAASHDEREAALVREAIEQPPAGVRGRRRPVLALIEKQPGLLSAAQVYAVLDPDLGD